MCVLHAQHTRMVGLVATGIQAIMPIFRTKFHPKKAPPRKKIVVSNLRREMDPQQLEQQFDIKIDNVRLDLGNSQIFELNVREGQTKWTALNTKHNKDNKPNSATINLESENNLLKLQVETLLDMLTETTIEAHLNSSELNGESATKLKRSAFRGRKLF